MQLGSEMRVMMEYVCQFDGEKKWDEILPVVERTLHPDLLVLDGKEQIPYTEFMGRLQKFVESGGFMEVIKLKKNAFGISYEINFHNPVKNKKTHTKSLGRFQDGKLVRVERDNAGRSMLGSAGMVPVL